MLDSSKFLTDEIITVSGTNPKKCMKCGKCLASCLSTMDISPHKFATRLADNNAEALLESKSLKKCLSCLACVERCPRGVEPASLVEAVRLAVIRQQGNNYLKPDDIPKLIENNDDIPQQLIVSAFRKYSK